MLAVKFKNSLPVLQYTYRSIYTPEIITAKRWYQIVNIRFIKVNLHIKQTLGINLYYKNLSSCIFLLNSKQ